MLANFLTLNGAGTQSKATGDYTTPARFAVHGVANDRAVKSLVIVLSAGSAFTEAGFASLAALTNGIDFSFDNLNVAEYEKLKTLLPNIKTNHELLACAKHVEKFELGTSHFLAVTLDLKGLVLRENQSITMLLQDNLTGVSITAGIEFLETGID